MCNLWTTSTFAAYRMECLVIKFPWNKMLLIWTVICVSVLVELVEPTIEEYREGIEGSNITLVCDPGTQSRPEITWRAPDGKAISNPRYSIQRGAYSDASNLHISSLKKTEDSGTFHCRWKGGHIRFQLVVLRKILRVRIKGVRSGKISMIEGESITLTCNVFGNPYPEPTYNWKFDDMAAGRTGRQFKLFADRSLNNRSVICTAQNSFRNGTNLSRKATRAIVKVQYLDKPAQTAENISVFESMNMTLRCSVEGNPTPDVEWRKSGSSKIIGQSPLLTIDKVSISDGGQYTCRVWNDAGEYRLIKNVNIVPYTGRDVNETDTTPIDNSTDSVDKITVQYIVGISVGIGLSLILIAFIVFTCKRKQGKKDDQRGSKSETEYSVSPSEHIYENSSFASERQTVLPYHSLSNNLNDSERVYTSMASGGPAHYEEPVLTERDGNPVANKDDRTDHIYDDILTIS